MTLNLLYTLSFPKKLTLKIGMDWGRSVNIAPPNHKARYGLSGRLVPSVGVSVSDPSIWKVKSQDSWCEVCS